MWLMLHRPLLSETWRDLVSLGSTAITLIGFALTIWQLRKTRGAAIAARDASTRAIEESRGHFRRYALANAVRCLAESKVYFEAESWRLVGLRLNDFADQVAQLASSDASWQPLLHELRVWEQLMKMPDPVRSPPQPGRNGTPWSFGSIGRSTRGTNSSHSAIGRTRDERG
jgi:hypothetical protein